MPNNIVKTELQNLAETLLGQVTTKKLLAEVLLDFKVGEDFLNNNNFSELILNLKYSQTEKLTLIRQKLNNCEFGTNLMTKTITRVLDKQFYALLIPSNWELWKDEFSHLVKLQGSIGFTTAIELNDKDLEKIHSLVQQKFNKQYFIDAKVKSNLIAGFILEHDAEIFDASIDNSLESYRQQWVKKMAEDNN